MHSRRQKYSLFLLAVIEVTYNDVVAVVAGHGLAHRLALDQMFPLGVAFDVPEKTLKSGISIGVAMRDVYGIVVACMEYSLHGNLTEKVKVWKNSPFLRFRLFW